MLEVVSLHCFWSIRRSAPSPLAAKPLASPCLLGMDSEDDAMSPWDREELDMMMEKSCCLCI